ncbi:hypothetical protein B0H12DRAFT_302970 [Mycena haematopus]|nr:hypothetical protein B0H12DRAFT_302970 [Mycena haematopus]
MALFLALLLLLPFTAADTCNGDNCLNALRAPAVTSTALSFCNSYTEGLYGTAAPTPTFVPTSCSPQRVSSACYCADNTGNPTYTPAPCPTSGQILENPSFYGQPISDPRNVDIRPWVIAVPTGAPGCVPAGSYSTADMDGMWGDPRSIECSFDPVVGGLSTVTQDILLCPSTQYTLRCVNYAAHVLARPAYSRLSQHRHRLRFLDRQRRLRDPVSGVHLRHRHPALGCSVSCLRSQRSHRRLPFRCRIREPQRGVYFPSQREGQLDSLSAAASRTKRDAGAGTVGPDLCQSDWRHE